MNRPADSAAPTIRLGASSWTAKGWLGGFYPSGTPQREFIAHYARRFPTVEVDATFYAIPAASTVDGWSERTPDGFVFAAKAPKTITHERFLEGCGEELATYLGTMARLGDKLGPVLFQFPYFSRKKGVTFSDFMGRLTPFLASLPAERPAVAVEVRNKAWLTPALFDLLREHNVALTLIDHPWMAPPEDLLARDGILTAPFVYIRWLGDRYAIEKITKVWDAPVLDRTQRLEAWASAIRAISAGGRDVFGYVNNHYSGFAPHDLGILGGLLGQDDA
jgi:uncharacterized protein YecE (DUF72 family)